ncbi:phage tail tape measure protein [Anaerocolumna aminovalerica]|uniref:phage tail tape measure protein n=1 Tax=Anaerocolumna aminovalerica TaxID=1527 RepID=UPI00209E8E44|nr:phage tail tape measure protein [Anaerocolumna aminovalerica]
MAGKVIDATLRFVDKFTSPMNKALDKVEKSSRKMQRLGRDVQKAGKNITDVGSTLTKGVTLPVVAAGAASIKTGIEFESAFAGVAKTVDATEEQLATLKQGIIDMSKEIPASTTVISGVAEAAGQLGIETENILDFTKVMIDLGNSTNLSAETAASSLAKYANVTGMSQKDFDKLGSVIVDLGNNFATTEADIVSMATRLAGAGSQIGLTDGEIMGFATALSSVGIEAEMGGSAFSKAMINMQLACETGLGGVQELSKKTGMSLRELQLMSENNSGDFKDLAQSLGYTNSEMKAMIKAGVNLENFADVAGMTSEQFKKSYEKDAAGALQSFIKGLGDTETKGESTIKMLQDMGFTEVRLRDTLTRLSQDGEGVAKAVSMGNTAWDKNNALTNEANQRYATTQSKIEVMKNKFSALGIQVSDILMPKVLLMVDKISAGIDKFSSLDDKTKNTIVKIAGIAAAVGPSLLVIGKLTGGVGGVITKIGVFGTVAKKSIGAFDKLKNVGKIGTAFAKFGNIGKVAFMGLTSPVTIAVAAIGALAIGAVLLIKNWNKVKAFFGNIGKIIKNVFNSSGAETKKFSKIFATVKNNIGSTVSNLGVIFGQIIKFLKPIVTFLTGVFLTAFKLVHSVGGGVISALVLSISGLVNGAIKILSGVIEFIAGVFTGNWSKAWGGISKIFGGIFEGFVALVKTPINAVIGIINGAINGINKLGFKIPDWVPFLGGKEFKINVPKIPMLAKGTNNWKGGLAVTQEEGGEIMDLPKGTRVYPHDKSIKKAYQDGTKSAARGSMQITIQKLADKIEVRSEADIDIIVNKLANRLERIINNGGGEVQPA